MVVTKEGGGSLCFTKERQQFALSRCTSRAWIPLLESLLSLLSAVQLSGKTYKDSDRMIVIAVVY